MYDFLNDIVEPKSPNVSMTFLDKEMTPVSIADIAKLARAKYVRNNK